MIRRIAVAIERTPKRTFVSAIDWPGLARSGKTLPAALESIAGYLERYAVVAGTAVESFPSGDVEIEVVETGDGGSGTEFGVPSRVTDADRRPTNAAGADRLTRLVASAWARFDDIAAGSPEELRKGPRGGGRDRTKIVGHVVESDWYYAREIGVRVKQPAPDDAAAVGTMRAAMLQVLRHPSDGMPLADRRWTTRYAAHRITWHSLDHAWEIEDRMEPAGQD